MFIDNPALMDPKEVYEKTSWATDLLMLDTPEGVLEVVFIKAAKATYQLN